MLQAEHKQLKHTSDGFESSGYRFCDLCLGVFKMTMETLELKQKPLSYLSFIFTPFKSC